MTLASAAHTVQSPASGSEYNTALQGFAGVRRDVEGLLGRLGEVVNLIKTAQPAIP
jgi:hypothetical protein